jgi:hypothetical protein
MDRNGELEYELVYAPDGSPSQYDINSANASFEFSSLKNTAAL